MLLPKSWTVHAHQLLQTLLLLIRLVCIRRCL